MTTYYESLRTLANGDISRWCQNATVLFLKDRVAVSTMYKAIDRGLGTRRDRGSNEDGDPNRRTGTF